MTPESKLRSDLLWDHRYTLEEQPQQQKEYQTICRGNIRTRLLPFKTLTLLQKYVSSSVYTSRWFYLSGYCLHQSPSLQVEWGVVVDGYYSLIVCWNFNPRNYMNWTYQLCVFNEGPEGGRGGGGVGLPIPLPSYFFFQISLRNESHSHF